MGLFEAFNKVSHQEWLDKITLDLKGKDYQETLVWKSEEGINVQPFYNQTTSIVIPQKKSNSWYIRETIFIENINLANQRALLALKGGASSILFIGDIESQAKMDELLSDIQTDIIDLNFYNSHPNITSKLVSIQEGSVSFDFLGEYAATGNWKNSQENDIAELVAVSSPISNFKTITVKNTLGSSIIQEVAFSLAHGVEYLNLLTNQDLDAKKVAAKIQFTFSISCNYFFEIAKIRAARKLWALILEQYNLENTSMTIHSETSASHLSEEDVHYNILRNTTKAMSAVLGGCDSLTVLAHDNDKKSIDFSNRIARNIQHILKEEAFFDKVINPADGAYYIESLTDEIANKAWKIFQDIEAHGGFLASLENDFIINQMEKIN